jgi:hypothetical protein
MVAMAATVATLAGTVATAGTPGAKAVMAATAAMPVRVAGQTVMEATVETAGIRRAAGDQYPADMGEMAETAAPVMERAMEGTAERAETVRGIRLTTAALEGMAATHQAAPVGTVEMVETAAAQVVRVGQEAIRAGPAGTAAMVAMVVPPVVVALMAATAVLELHLERKATPAIRKGLRWTAGEWRGWQCWRPRVGWIWGGVGDVGGMIEKGSRHRGAEGPRARVAAGNARPYQPARLPIPTSAPRSLVPLAPLF